MNSHKPTSDQAVFAGMAASQATHDEALCRSVGMAVLGLEKTYPLVEISEEKFFSSLKDRMQSELSDCKDVTADEIKAVVDGIKLKFAEENDRWDNVTLYLPEKNQEKEYKLPIKKVLPLVWEATLDDKAYVHSDQGSDKDRSNRVLTFFKCLERIKIGICHLGIRHELVLTLNGVYKDIHIIENAKAEILCLLRDKINKQFWSEYQSDLIPEKKKRLESALMDWISNSNPSQVLGVIDNRIRAEIDEHFEKHGINPKKSALRETVDNALNSLEFACDPKQYPSLARVNVILNAIESKTAGQEERSKALSAVQEWIPKNYRFDDEKHEDNRSIVHFGDVYTLHKDVMANRIVLMVTGQMNDKEIDEVDKHCRDYFNQCKPPVFPSVNPEELVKTIALKVANAKQNSMSNQIENFFARWFVAFKNNNLSEARSVYMLLLQDQFQKRVELTTDEVIYKLAEENREDKYLNISPYVINRVFLHAILKEPEKWSPYFYEFFKKVFGFVQKKFEQTGGLAESLHQTSYPKYLVNQLKYLDAKRRGAEEKRPEGMLLLPNQFRTAGEWICISRVVDSATLDVIYTPLAATVNMKLREFVTDSTKLLQALMAIPIKKRYSFMATSFSPDKIKALTLDVDILAIVLKVLPAASLKQFMESPLGAEIVRARTGFMHELAGILRRLSAENLKQFIESPLGAEIIRERIQDGYDCWVTVLQNLSAESLKQFMESPLGTEIIRMQIRDADDLLRVLKALSGASRKQFITSSLGVEIITKSIQCGDELAEVLGALPEAERYPFIISSLDAEIVKWIQGAYDLLSVLKTLPQVKRYPFITSPLGAEIVRARVKNGYALADMLNVLPEAERYPFIISSLGAEIVKWIQGMDDLPLVLKALPNSSQKQFIESSLGAKIIKKWVQGNSWVQGGYQLAKILDALPQVEQYPFITSPLGAEIVRTLQNGHGLASVLDALSEAERYPFIMSPLGAEIAKEKIEGADDLLSVLRALPAVNLINFIDSPLGTEIVNAGIQNRDELDKVVCALPEITGYSPMVPVRSLSFKLAITVSRAKGCLADAIGVLPKADRYAFILSLAPSDEIKALIQNTRDLAAVLNALPETERYPHIELLGADKINEVFRETKCVEGHALAQVLSAIPEKQFQQFMVLSSDAITEGLNKKIKQEGIAGYTFFAQQHMIYLLLDYVHDKCKLINPSSYYLNNLQQQFKFICKNWDDKRSELFKSIEEIDQHILMPLRVKRDELNKSPDSVNQEKAKQLNLLIAGLKEIAQTAISEWITSNGTRVDLPHLKQKMLAEIKKYEQKEEIKKHANNYMSYFWVKTNTQQTLIECQNKLIKRM